MVHSAMKCFCRAGFRCCSRMCPPSHCLRAPQASNMNGAWGVVWVASPVCSHCYGVLVGAVVLSRKLAAS